jgi:hypothetical protein
MVPPPDFSTHCIASSSAVNVSIFMKMPSVLFRGHHAGAGLIIG